jgi:hypothetical protein
MPSIHFAEGKSLERNTARRRRPLYKTFEQAVDAINGVTADLQPLYDVEKGKIPSKTIGSKDFLGCGWRQRVAIYLDFALSLERHLTDLSDSLPVG